MSQPRPLQLLLVANEGQHHKGAVEYERIHGGGPDRSDAFGPLRTMAELAERGFFSAMFLADSAGMGPSPALDVGPPEPITAMSALSREFRHIGLIGTASTTYYDPYNLARLFGSFDLISGGRAGFNAVTSVGNEWAQNYSLPGLPDRDVRYRRAEEFLETVLGLWGHRELRRDADGVTRYYAEPTHHAGEFFQVRGPLNVSPSPQGRPLIVQAGGSGQGIALAGKYAELVFTNANSLDQAAQYRDELDAALVAAGRAAGSVPIFPGMTPYLGRTTAEAEERLRELDSYIDVEIYAPKTLAAFGLPLEYDSIDDPFPLDALPDPEEVKYTLQNAYGNYVGFYTWVHARPGVTVREAALNSLARGGAQHRKFVGSYDEFVEECAAWHAAGHIAGFNMFFPIGAISIREFVDEVVPRLIDRGVYIGGHDDRTLRERFAR